VHKSARLLLIVLSYLSPCGLAFAAEPPIADGEVRSLARVTVTSVDAAARKISFLHEPTGYRFNVIVSQSPNLTRLNHVDPDRIIDGSYARFWGFIDPRAKTIRAGARVFLQPEPHPAPYVPGQTTIAGRLHREPISKPDRDNGWTTLDGKSTIVLETSDSARWHLVATTRGEVTLVETGTFSDFQKDRTADVTMKRVHDHWELVNAYVDVWPPGAELLNGPGHGRGAGPSGVTAADYQAKLDTCFARLAVLLPDLNRLMPVTFNVTPQLVLPGEPVTLQIKALAARKPNSTATVYPDFFHTDMKKSREIFLSWQLTGSEGGCSVYTASATLPSQATGQYFVEWKCDIGGDIDKYSRSYAVCDKHSAVCLYQITTDGKPKPEAVFHKLHIPVDYWANLLYLEPWEHVSAAAVSETSRRYREYGDNPGFCLEHYVWGAAQVRREPLDLQLLQIRALEQLVPIFRFDPTNIGAWSYTIGNATYRMLQKEGRFTVTSLCTENHIDGNAEINHWGKPERPYFMSEEDFRKAGPGGKAATVAFSQVQRLTYLARQYGCDFNIEPANGALNQGAGARTVPDEVYFSRILDFYDALFQMVRCQTGPYFISEGIEFNGSCFGAAEGNRMVVEYAARKARDGNVVFSTTRGVADFYKKHFTRTPESTCYFQDYWAGVMFKDKPIAFADSMSIENATLYSLALRGQLIPEFQYDYTAKWDFPDFGNELLPHRIGDSMAYMIPGKYDKYAATPTCVDTRTFHATRKDAVAGSALTINVTVDAKVARKALTLSLWDIPREFKKGASWFNASEGARFVPIVAPYTDNLNGFLIVDVKAGSNSFTLRIDSPPRELKSLDFSIGDYLKGKVYVRNGVTMAYVWNSLPWASTLSLTLPQGKAATVFVAPEGVEQTCRAGENLFKIPQGRWLRIKGLSGDEIAALSKQL